MTDIAVVLPTHQRRGLLLAALAALFRQTADPARFEIIVVCDGCTDGTAAAARAAGAAAGGSPRLTVLEQPRSGAATARNRGAAACSAPLLLFLDDDMIAEPGLVEAHLDRHAREPGRLLLGHMPVHPDSPRSYLTEGLARWAGRRHEALSRPGVEVPVGEVLTGHLSLSRREFERLGGFDARFTAGGSFGGEDVEFGWRARRLGIPIAYEPRARSSQVYDKTFRALCRNIRHGGAADALMARLHPEVAEHLTLGRIDSLPPWERRALRGTLRWPAAASLLGAPLVTLLDLAARAGGRGRLLEALHAVCRAHLYGLGMLDAGPDSSGSRTA